MFPQGETAGRDDQGHDGLKDRVCVRECTRTCTVHTRHGRPRAPEPSREFCGRNRSHGWCGYWAVGVCRWTSTCSRSHGRRGPENAHALPRVLSFFPKSPLGYITSTHHFPFDFKPESQTSISHPELRGARASEEETGSSGAQRSPRWWRVLHTCSRLFSSPKRVRQAPCDLQNPNHGSPRTF